MSDSLTSDTPVEDAAATAPASDTAANDGSVDSPDVIPKERFNGLQSKYQSEKSSWEAERAALVAEVESLRTAGEEQPTIVADTELAEAVRGLQAELAQEKRGRALERALEKHPKAAAFADLIVGDPSDYEAIAAALEERISSLIPSESDGTDDGDADNANESNGSSADSTNDGANGEPPVVAPSTSVDETMTAQEAVAAAVQAGDFAALMAAKERLAREAQGADLSL